MMAGRFAVSAIFTAVDRITRPISRMQQRVGRFTRALERGLRNAQRATAKFAAALGKLGKRALIAAGAAVTGLYFALGRVSDQADALAKQSRRLQFPIEELQEWKFVAEQSGVSSELLDKSLGAFTKRLGEAKAGTGPLVSNLKKMNPQLLRTLKQTDNVADAFEIYVDAMRNAETATEKAALANAAFSRAGLDLVNISQNSSEAVKKLRIEQRQNGNITMEQAEAAERYNDAVNSLKRALSGIIASVLLPLADVLADQATKWREVIVANKDLIKQKVAAFFEKAGSAARKIIGYLKQIEKEHGVLEALGEVAKQVASAFVFMAEHGKTILKVVGVVLALNLALKAFTIVMAIVNSAILANPFFLIAAAIAALIIWWDDLVEAVSRGLEPVFRVFEQFMGVMKKIGSVISDSLKSIRQWVSDGIEWAAKKVEAFIDTLDRMYQGLKKFLGFETVGDKIKQQETAFTVKKAALKHQLGKGQISEDQYRNELLFDNNPYFRQKFEPIDTSLLTGRAQISSPQERIARSIEEKKTSTEVTIKDETGRAEVSKGQLGGSVKLEHSGAFSP